MSKALFFFFLFFSPLAHQPTDASQGESYPLLYIRSTIMLVRLRATIVRVRIGCTECNARKNERMLFVCERVIIHRMCITLTAGPTNATLPLATSSN